MMKIYWIEVRRSPLLWCLPLLIAVDMAAVFGRSQYWIGVWPQASAAAQIPALFFAPAFSAAAAWAVGRSLRRGIAEQRGAAARPAWHMEAAQFTATVTYGVVVYGLGAAAAAAVSVPDAGPGFLWPSYLLLGISVMIACSAVGHAVGRLARSTVAAPVICGLACFVAVGGAGSPRNLGFYVLSGDPGIEINRVALAVRLALAAALVAAAVCVPALLRRGRTGWAPGTGYRAVGLGALLAVVTAVGSLPVAGSIRADRAAPKEPLCSNGSPRVCLWPEDRKYLQQTSAMAERLGAIPQDWIRTPDAFYELGVRPDGPETANDFSIVEGNLWFAAPNMAGSIIQLSLPPRCEALSPENANKVGTAIAQIEMWLEFRAMGTSETPNVQSDMPPGDLAAAQGATRLPEAGQADWVQQRLNVIHEAPCA
ncbi:ABC transporter permease [Streptomyces sp. NPDC085540]|uniref:ABC transporter permease n=1 Tax=Streptomyces sp. NPDC085540 TaxID=3365730 RepID=UPI0037D0A475